VAALLESGRYQPKPVRRVEIEKPGGGKRLLGIPSVLDRVIQQAIAQVLSKEVDGSFHPSSYGFRPGKSAHQAIQQLRADKQSGYSQAVDLDLEKFFDKVNHEVLMRLLRRRIEDKRVLRLIGKYLRAGVEVAPGRMEPTSEGVPQGGPLSPLLANILHDELEKRGHRSRVMRMTLSSSPKASERRGGCMRASSNGWSGAEAEDQRGQKPRLHRGGGRVPELQLRGKRIVATEAAVADMRHRVKELTGGAGESRCLTHPELNSYLRAGADTSASGSSGARSWNGTSGCGEGCGCAGGNAGAESAAECVNS
jgi:RNA-directed DNA polymerase